MALLTWYSVADMRTTPPPPQNACHGNPVCLATRLRNLQFMAAYFKNCKTRTSVKHQDHGRDEEDSQNQVKECVY